MGLTVVLETERGERIETVEDPANVLHHVLPSNEDASFRCLSFIDWYGDTVFNYLQAKDFLVEWQRVKPKVSGPHELALLARIENLARRVANDRHLYLKFYGD